MIRSLYTKLSLALLLLFCLTGILFIAITLFSTEMYQSEVNQKLNAKLAENIVAEKLLMESGRINQEALGEIFHMLMVINPSIELYLLNPAGRILAYSAPPDKVKLEKIDLAPVRKWFARSTPLPILGEDPRNPGIRKAITVARIPKEGPLEGYLYVILGGEEYDSVIQKLKGSYILQTSAWIIAAAVLFAVLAGVLIFAQLTKRLKKLSMAMDFFRDRKTIQSISRMNDPAPILSDEVDRLWKTFIQMAQHIESQMEEIQNSDTLRRELIANVSHDLRTPIATLQGYVETLLIKEKTLSTEERNAYLHTVNKHCERLSKLVEDLFDLAKLDSHETRPGCEPFNLADLAHDIVQKFQLAADQKKITFQIELDKKLPFAYADISLIERAFENLLENAVRHTPEGGTIRLALDTAEQDIVVQISDTGPGIPSQEIPHIFNRFYKLDKSRQDLSGHSGLGLAITKRIIELHGKSIQVASAPDSGTSFTFQLPTEAPSPSR